jgi:hypothetical protein
MYGLQSLLNNKICKNHQEIADKIGVNRTLVVETLGLAKLPENTKKLLLEKGTKSRNLLRDLLKQPEESHVDMINAILKEKEAFEKPKKNKKERGYKILSVILKDEQVCFEENENLFLGSSQKETLKEGLLSLVKKIGE